MNQPLIEAGQRYVEAEINIIPVNDRKKPAIKTWKEYQNGTRVTLEDIEKWAKIPWAHGWAAICGEPSGNLIVLDFDVEGIYERWCEKVGPIGKELPVQQTGSGTYQTWFRCDLPLRNDKLAYIAANNEEGREAAIETRANGGYAVAAPSFCPQAEKRGIKHKQPYRVIQGDLANPPIISESVVEKLFEAARSLDECPLTKKQMQGAPLHGPTGTPGGIREAFNQRYTIHEILERNGYKRLGKRYLAPASTTGGPGVHIFEDTGTCFSHHANDSLNTRKSHDAFSSFCILEHGDDFKAAAKAAELDLGITFPARDRRIQTQTQEPKAAPSPPPAPLQWPDEVMTGPAGRFARTYADYLETPTNFLYMAYLTLVGHVISDRITLRSEITPQPRLFTVLLGESADVRKSTSISKTYHFF